MVEIYRNSHYLDIHMSAEEAAAVEHQSLRYEKRESHGVLVCLAMGESAGRTAAMAATSESHDVQLLRKKILDNGGYIL